MTDQLVRYWDVMETIRNNQVVAAERERSNRANEAIAQQQVALGYANLAESQRANRAREEYNIRALEQNLTVVDLNNTNRLQTAGIAAGSAATGAIIGAGVKIANDNKKSNKDNDNNKPGGGTPSTTNTTSTIRVTSEGRDPTASLEALRRATDSTSPFNYDYSSVRPYENAGLPFLPSGFLGTLGNLGLIFG